MGTHPNFAISPHSHIGDHVLGASGALYGFELFGNGTKRQVPPQKTKAEAVKAVQRELRNLALNYLEW